MASVTSLPSQSSIYAAISSLMALERKPVVKLTSRKGDLQTLSGVYSDLKTKLLALRASAKSLADIVDAPLSARAVSSSDSTVVEATATSAAALGSHTIKVTQLARHHTMVSDRFTSSNSAIRTAIGTGDFTFTIVVNGESTDVTVTIDSDDTDDDVIDKTAAAINTAMEDKDYPVSATSMNDTATTSKLVLRSDETGSAYKMALSDRTGTLLATLGIDDEAAAATDTTGGYIYADSALDAIFTLDGVEITRSSNVVSDVLHGVTLTLKAAQATGDDEVSLTVVADTTAITESIQDFITKYNDAVSHLRAKTAVDSATGTRQPLGGQYIYRSLLSDLRTTVANAATTGSSDITLLSEIGITQDDDGNLSISDSDELESAIKSEPDAVAALFTAADGIATSIEALLESFVEVGGHLESDMNSVSERISSIDESIRRLEARAAIRERQLIAQYSKLQEVLVRMSRQQNLLGSFLETYKF